MKVKNLIEKLQTYNPEAEVRLNGRSGDVALFVNSLADDDSFIWIDGENDFDLGQEISVRFKEAPYAWESELDFYMGLLEIGIDVDMVRKYMGNENADHMEQFCVEHGLI